jgi:heme iron utilization protein
VNHNKDLIHDLKNLFQIQKFAVLATTGKTHPHASLVAFIVTDDLKHLYFATARSTRKFKNMETNPKVALLVDNRSNLESDFENAIAVTVYGTVCSSEYSSSRNLLEVYLDKYPKLQSFIESPDTAFVQINVEKYTVVSQFQNVREIIPE